MKSCSYCGRTNTDDALFCRECGTKLEPARDAPPPRKAEPLPPGTKRPEYELEPLPANARQQTFVTLVKCRTLVAADMVVARLRAEGINTFLPDETLMQVVGWNFNTYGYVRVQVAPEDYDPARAVIEDLAADAGEADTAKEIA